MLARGKDLSDARALSPHFRSGLRRFPKHRKVRRCASRCADRQASEDASWHLQASVVDTDDKLAERVTFIHERIGGPSVRQYRGRELYVGVSETIAARAADLELTLAAWRRALGCAERSARSDIRARGISTDRPRPVPIPRSHPAVAKRIFRTLELDGYAHRLSAVRGRNSLLS
jgi:D-alanine-D-alanine ligase